MEKLNEINQLLEESNIDAVKFYNNGNKAAGTRLRATMLKIKNLAHEVRKEVSTIKNEQ